MKTINFNVYLICLNRIHYFHKGPFIYAVKQQNDKKKLRK